MDPAFPYENKRVTRLALKQKTKNSKKMYGFESSVTLQFWLGFHKKLNKDKKYYTNLLINRYTTYGGHTTCHTLPEFVEGSWDLPVFF